MQQSASRKIAFFMPSFRGGGAERATILLAEGALQLGYDVDLIVVQADGPLRSLVPTNLKVIDLGKKRASQSLFPLISYLRREKPLALYATIFHTNIVATLATKLSLSKTKLFLRESNSPKTMRKKTVKSQLAAKLIPLLYPLADKVISVSKGVSSELLAMAPALENKLTILPQPIVTDKLFALANEPLAHPWFQQGEPPVIVAAGRLHPQKDFVTLLSAFARVRKETPLRLVILGEGDERPRLEALVRQLGIEADVELPGFVENPFSYINRAAMFVLSSRYEGMPNVLLQAMALGTPVVATDCPSGPRDIIGQNHYGTLVSVGDIDALAVAIAETLPSSRRKDAAAFAAAHYSVSHAVSEYVALIGEA